MNTLTFTQNNNFQTFLWSVFSFVAFLATLVKPLAIGLSVAVVVLVVAANPTLMVLGLLVGIISLVVMVFVYDAVKK